MAHVMEQLVQDNETLKHDNDELQHLLGESREDLHALQEEVDEQRANIFIPRSGGMYHFFDCSSIVTIIMLRRRPSCDT